MPQLKGLSISSPGGAVGAAYRYRDKAEHQLAWERGNIDYTGVDSFANIQAHLDKRISSSTAAPDVRPKIPPLSAIATPSTASQATPTITSSLSKGKPIKGVLKKPKE